MQSPVARAWQVGFVLLMPREFEGNSKLMHIYTYSTCMCVYVCWHTCKLCRQSQRDQHQPRFPQGLKIRLCASNLPISEQNELGGAGWQGQDAPWHPGGTKGQGSVQPPAQGCSAEQRLRRALGGDCGLCSLPAACLQPRTPPGSCCPPGEPPGCSQHCWGVRMPRTPSLDAPGLCTPRTEARGEHPARHCSTWGAPCSPPSCPAVPPKAL